MKKNSHHKRIKDSGIPSWLWVAITGGREFTPEEEVLAYKVVKGLKETSKHQYWPPEILKHVLRFNEFDCVEMYGRKHD